MMTYTSGFHTMGFGWGDIPNLSFPTSSPKFQSMQQYLSYKPSGTKKPTRSNLGGPKFINVLGHGPPGPLKSNAFWMINCSSLTENPAHNRYTM